MTRMCRRRARALANQISGKRNLRNVSKDGHWKRKAMTEAMTGIARQERAAAACRDQLDVVNLCSMELLLREAQMIEQFYKEEERSKHDKKMKDQKQKRGLSAEEIDLYLGAGKNFSEVMVAPTLTEYISKQLEREASISKNTRKAREERALARV